MLTDVCPVVIFRTYICVYMCVYTHLCRILNLFKEEKMEGSKKFLIFQKRKKPIPVTGKEVKILDLSDSNY